MADAAAAIMAPSEIDGNAWYHLTEHRVNFTSALFYNGNGSPYFARTDNQSFGMFWQVYRLENGNFQFRNRNSNVRQQLGACFIEAEVDSGKTQPCMRNSSADLSQQWVLDRWSDGSFKITNAENGTDRHLDWHPGNPGFLSPDTEELPKQPAQHWVFSSLAAVDDGIYSVSVTTTTGAATSQTASSTPFSASATATTTDAAGNTITSVPLADDSQQDSGSSGLSGGAAAGIGVGVAAVVVLLAALIIFMVRRKRKQAATGDIGAISELADDGYKGSAVLGKSYEKEAPVYEVSAAAPQYEMYSEPSELPSDTAGSYRTPGR